MEAAAEKMAALKKVYADIILNMAKESAARVLASERRALGLQQGLSASKDEALGTLLRLKAIMDSRIREAQTTSMGQLRRIHELEVQLNEAEGTISSLRTELKRVNNELEKTKNNIARPLNGQNTSGHLTSSIDERQESKPSSDPVLCSPVGSGHTSPFDNKNATLSQKSEGLCYSIENAAQAESLKVFSSENESVSNPDLASIIMRSKEPDLYRNGCTQRIRAFEQNLLTAKVPRGQNDGQLLNLKGELIICENGKTERTCSIDSALADKIIVQVKNPTESKEIVQHTSSFGNGQVKFSRRASLRRRRGKRNHIKSTNRCIFPGQDMADQEPSETVSCKKSEDRKNCPGILKNGSSMLLQCSKTALPGQNVTGQSHSDSDNQILQSPSSSAENIGCVSSIRDPLLFTGMNDGLLPGPDHSDAGNTLQVQVSLLTTPNQNVTEHSHISLCMNPENSNIPITNSDVKDEKICESSGTSQAGSNRFLKYTFQRKRKRGSSNSKDEDTLLEKKSASKRRTGDKQNALIEPQKTGIVMELPRNNRRLVQVARQLISLSERRW